MKNILSSIIFIFLLLLFFLIFKNLSYPLLWNDEAETVMFGEQILKYGYPKIHGEKNVVHGFSVIDPNLGQNKKFDIYTGTVWGHFYYSTIGILIARLFSDLYQKTFILRLPFAISGFIGILLFGCFFTGFLKKNNYKKLFLIFYFIIESLSISLLLHLREVRYYPLQILLINLNLILYLSFIYKKISSKKIYVLLQTFLLILLFNIYYPAFYITLIVFAISNFSLFKNKKSDLTIIFLPLICSFLLTLPQIMLINPFEASNSSSKYWNFNFLEYINNLNSIIRYFLLYEILPLVLIIKLIILFIYKKRENHNEYLLKISSFLFLFFLIYVFSISFIPYLFERYYISLQPILAIIYLLDLFFIFNLLKFFEKKVQKKYLYIIILCSCIFILSKLPILNSYHYQLTHQYKGPLDYIIPYIKNNYKNPQNLVIATNYEENTYMYYLGSKTTIGYIGNNIENDLKFPPDIIIIRKCWPDNRRYLNQLLNENKYKKVIFPIGDTPTNNIPEISSYPFSHQFKSPDTISNLITQIYIKINK